MDSADADRPDIDAVMDDLRRRVEEHRREGLYPPGLEDDLEAHFRRIAGHRTDPKSYAVRDALAVLDARRDVTTERITADSGVPGGERMHRALAKLQARQIEGVLAQVRDALNATYEVTGALADAVEAGDSHVHHDLVGELDAMLERVTTSACGGVDAPVMVGELLGRVERLEAAEARRQFRPFFSRAQLAEELVAPATTALARLVELFADVAPVLDLAAGTGAVVARLRAAGVDATGVESDGDLVVVAQERGVPVELAEPVRAVVELLDGTLGGAALVGAVERLPAQDVADVVFLLADKLRPAGVAVCVAADPRSPEGVASAFAAGPLGGNLVHPDYLAFVFRQAGFTTVEVEGASAGRYTLVATR